MGRQAADVLIVDDNELAAASIADGVRLAGYTMCGIAGTVEQALGLARQHRPVLAVVDVNLGEEGSGVDLARQLVEIAPMGIFYVTGYPEQVRNADIGHAWMMKPYRVLDLINSLQVVRALNERAPITVPIPQDLHLLGRHAP